MIGQQVYSDAFLILEHFVWLYVDGLFSSVGLAFSKISRGLQFTKDLYNFQGKNAEAIGEDGTLWALSAWSCCTNSLLRSNIRKKQGNTPYIGDV